jgi:hypothetical protein
MKAKFVLLIVFGITFFTGKAQFQTDGSFKVGSYFNIHPSGRINGNLIFGNSIDQNGGIIRGAESLGLEFLTLSDAWHIRMRITPEGNFKYGDFFNLFPSGRLNGNLILGGNNDTNIGIIRSEESTGIGFLTYTNNVWHTRMSISLDGSFKYGDYFNLFPSGRIQGNLIFGSGNDQNGGIIRGGASSGIEFLTFDGLWQTRLLITKDGRIGIGTDDPKCKLAVNGVIRSTEVNVMADINVPDYVFEDDYNLLSLEETKQFIIANKHLPEIPSASEINENGIDLAEMNMKLLKKIEELTLHQIELLDEINELKKQFKKLEEVN